jgi:iron-sulfur cluster assembly 1
LQKDLEPFQRMSLTYSAPSIASSALRLAALHSRQLRCPQCLRSFSSSRPFQTSARRKLQTASALHPANLEPPPPPPRNAFTPGARITRDTGSRQDAETITAEKPAAPSKEEQQQQQQIAASPLPSESQPQQQQQQQKKPPTRHFKFAPRKAAIKLSPTAVAHVRQLLDQPEPKLLRIGTKNRGCSGLAYNLEYVDKPGKFDETIEQDGVKVLIESRTLLHIIGSEMDWVEDKLSARFVFKNPNISEFFFFSSW